MEKKIVLGVDISKKKLDVCLIRDKKVLIETQVQNKVTDICSLLKRLAKEFDFTFSTLLICAEHTGMYSYALICASEHLQINLWMEDPSQIKYSSGVTRGKNDRIDAHRIAMYAIRFMDKQRPYQALEKDVQDLKQLESERSMLVTDRAKYLGQLKDQKEYMDPLFFHSKRQRLVFLIESLDKIIKEIELQINHRIDKNQVLARQVKLLKSVEGVGEKVALKMIILTNGFSRFTDPRKFACHAGVVPFAYLSGSSRHSKYRLSNRADKSIKTLLHLAALSILSKKDSELKRYYIRKTQEGKNKMAVINAIRAKIITRMFAVIKYDREYQLFFQDKLA